MDTPGPSSTAGAGRWHEPSIALGSSGPSPGPLPPDGASTGPMASDRTTHRADRVLQEARVTSRMHRSHRAAGALVGSAVGDALGGPFEFGPPGQFSARFPVPARGSKTEMCGGGSLGWEPGEFTDDTQMALLVAESLIENDRLAEADLF